MRPAQWVVYLNTGRFGDWVVITGPETEEGVRKLLTRAQRRKAGKISRAYRPGEREPVVLAPKRRRAA